MQPRYKIWLESENGQFILGEGTYVLLCTIEEKGSLSEAARSLNISYAHAWRKIREIESNYGKKVVEKRRGGKSGGSSTLTVDGKSLLQVYERLKKAVETALQI